MEKLGAQLVTQAKIMLRTMLITHKEMGQYILAEKLMAFGSRKDPRCGFTMD